VGIRVRKGTARRRKDIMNKKKEEIPLLKNSNKR